MQQLLEKPTSTAELEALSKLSKDVKAKIKTLGKDEIRFLVDYYYQMQHDRIVTEGRIRAINQSSKDEPHEAIAFIGKQVSTVEENIKKILDIYTKNDPVGVWCRSIIGCGPVIAAGLLANLDIEAHLPF